MRIRHEKQFEKECSTSCKLTMNYKTVLCQQYIKIASTMTNADFGDFVKHSQYLTAQNYPCPFKKLCQVLDCKTRALKELFIS